MGRSWRNCQTLRLDSTHCALAPPALGLALRQRASVTPGSRGAGGGFGGPWTRILTGGTIVDSYGLYCYRHAMLR